MNYIYFVLSDRLHFPARRRTLPSISLFPRCIPDDVLLTGLYFVGIMSEVLNVVLLEVNL